MRILANGHVYRQLACDALSEQEYERLIIQESSAVFPGYRVVEFRAPIQSEFGCNEADFALIHEGYQEWWVVEVELAHHSLEGHVLPQVESLAVGSYGRSEAEYLAARCGDLDLARLEQMMLGSQPRVLVVVNENRSGWRPILSIVGAEVLVGTVFRSSLDRHILVFDGFVPSINSEVISLCTPEPALGRVFLAIGSPAALDVEHLGSIDIEYNGRLTTWSRLDVHDSVWLYPQGGGAPEIRRPVELVRAQGGGLFFRDARRR